MRIILNSQNNTKSNSFFPFSLFKKVVPAFLLSLLIIAISHPAFGQEDLFGQLKSQPREGTSTISSDKLEFDYQDFVAHFEGNVKVVDPQFVLTADRILVYFDKEAKTNEVRRLDAVGNVKVTSEDRAGSCGRAIYTRATQSIALTQNPVVSKGENVLRGEKITIWLGESRIDVEGGVQIEGVAGSDKEKRIEEGEKKEDERESDGGKQTVE